MATPSSTLAWRIPWMEEPGRTTVHGVEKSQIQLSDFIFQFFATQWTKQFMDFFRPEQWGGQLFPSPGDLPNPGIKLRSPALQADSLPAEPPGKPKNTGVGSLSFLQWIFQPKESNWGLLHCRQILSQLSYQGSPFLPKDSRYSDQWLLFIYLYSSIMKLYINRITHSTSSFGSRSSPPTSLVRCICCVQLWSSRPHCFLVFHFLVFGCWNITLSTRQFPFGDYCELCCCPISNSQDMETT